MGKVIILNGSPKANGNTATALHEVEDAAAKGMTPETSDWMQGYGYQMWRCRPGCFRADGARGQYIIVVPDKNAVIAITSDNADLQGELNLVWERILPVL